MARRLMGPDARQERATQQRLTSRIANAQAGAIQKAIARAMRAAADKFADEGRLAVGPAVEDQRPNVQRTVTGLYEGAFDTLGGRILRAAKSLHGSQWVHKQSAEEELAEARRQFIAQWSANQVSLVMSTTDRQIKRIIEQGERDGVGVDEIARRIRNNGPELSRVRSQVIARTETHNAGQAAQDAAAKAGGAARQKEWFASLDDRTRDDKFSHVDADSEIVDMDGVFTNTGEEMRYPGDPRGSSGNVVMCRCGQGYLVD